MLLSLCLNAVRVIFVKESMDSGIFLIGHLINSDGNVLLFGKLKRKCPPITNNKLFDAGRGTESHQRIPEG